MEAGIVVKYLTLWQAQETHPQRACDFCLFGDGEAGNRECTHPELPRSSCKVSRSYQGVCGPEAKYWHYKAPS